MPTFIDRDLVCSLFNYDENSGELTRKNSVGRHGRYKPGSLVGTIHECGRAVSRKRYLRAGVGGSYIYIHRIIWVIMTGEQPLEIDHIDGNGLNNKFSNLRNVSHKLNGKNQKTHKHNTSGVSGITFRKDSNKWRARITVNDVSISLGTFKNKDDAIAARKEAEIKYNFL